MTLGSAGPTLPAAIAESFNLAHIIDGLGYWAAKTIKGIFPVSSMNNEVATLLKGVQLQVRLGLDAAGAPAAVEVCVAGCEPRLLFQLPRGQALGLGAAERAAGAASAPAPAE